MPKTDTHPVYASDLEDVAQVLGACLTFLQARDLMEAQIAFSTPRPSPLSNEVQRLHDRFRGYMGDFLLAAREAELEEDDGDDQDSELEAENGSDEPVEASEVLSDSPLGKPRLPRQRGRRLDADEV